MQQLLKAKLSHRNPKEVRDLVNQRKLDKKRSLIIEAKRRRKDARCKKL